MEEADRRETLVDLDDIAEVKRISEAWDDKESAFEDDSDKWH